MDKLWNVVKQIKIDTSVDKTCKDGTLNNDGLYTDMLEQVQAVEKELGIESSEDRLENLTTTDLKNAAEMFIYLNICPKTLKPWLVFYRDLFQTESLERIVLTLNRMMKGTGTDKYFKSLAQKLFKKISSLFSLKYEKIQSMFMPAGNASLKNSTRKMLKGRGKRFFDFLSN